MTRTAGYLVEIHPDQAEKIAGQLDRLPDDNPVKISLGIILGVSQYVELQVCDTCGAVVHDDTQHSTWHDQHE